ncbi:flagellar hook assembly protein FlgD [Parvibaculum sp.]|uniref:flagellar hook assembly protein FlgD n=1 Tax=Parvibaculum sp. TaxID=2024848 RepID=UPI002CA2872B|nr:flagellar hook assembly protein FlgD [Parvibaculum sp.]HUD51292.1 flagellar hook assembly protein FlgD [Parvibaculum sp.]
MSVESIAAAAASASSSSSSTASTALSGNYEMFLTLLTTQLQHQDPTNPMDSSEFTSQLVQYSSVEQQIQANKNLETLISTVGNQNATFAINMLGKEVTAVGTGAALADGKANWGYNLASDAASVNVSVLDSNGNTVYSTSLSNQEAGNQTFTWDGKDSAGTAQPDGTYYISVTANDASGTAVAATTTITGKVTAVDFSNGTPKVTVNGAQVDYANITAVSNPS